MTRLEHVLSYFWPWWCSAAAAARCTTSLATSLMARAASLTTARRRVRWSPARFPGAIRLSWARPRPSIMTTGKIAGVLAESLPFPVDRAVLERGQDRYRIFCTPCHGELGDGRGMIVRRGFNPPPSYHSDELRKQPVGHYFDVMTRGFGTMYSYASRVPARDRWAIAAYIRALQLSQHAAVSATSSGRSRASGRGCSMTLANNQRMMCEERMRLRLERVGTRAVVVAVAAFAMLAGSWVLWPRHFFAAYLVGYLFWLGIVLGSIGLTMLHHLVGGSWGLVIRRPLEAGAATVPLFALLFLPIAMGTEALFPWARAEGASHLSTAVRTGYLNQTLFLLRTLGYFGIWTALAFLLVGWSSRQDHTSDHRLTERLRRLSGPGTVILFAASSFAAVDWVMSLEAPWVSTIFGAMVITGEAMATFAAMIVVTAFLAADLPMFRIATPERLNDLGNLLLAFVMLWAYMSFSQYLIIWSGNLIDEIPWYLKRTRGGWEWVALALVVCQFFLPFFLLLIRENKRHVSALVVVALVILVMHWIDLVWLVIPASNAAASPRMDWIEIALERTGCCRRGRNLDCRFPRALEATAPGAAERPQLTRSARALRSFLTVDETRQQARLLADSATAHEANRVTVQALLYFAAGLVGVNVLVLVALAFVMRGFAHEEKELEALALPRFAGDTGVYPRPDSS